MNYLDRMIPRPPSSTSARTSADEEVLKARSGSLAFTRYTFPAYEANWHHERLCVALDKWAEGLIRRLMIFMPPRRGKSELVSRRLPAYILGKYPDMEIAAASYAADLARSLNRDTQRIIDSDEYRRLFPKTRLYGSNVRATSEGAYLRNSDEFEIVGHRGRYKCAGVGGGLTGRGFSRGIIDDPFKDRKEADSQVIRQAVWDWYTNVFYTRQAPGAAILLTMTRWHEDDLAGRLLDEMKAGGEQWEIISFPEVRETEEDPRDPRAVGEVLWPGRYTVADAESTKRAVGTRTWAALYQQRPTPGEGGKLKRHWWRYWKPKGTQFPPVTVKLDDGTLVLIEAIDLPDEFDEIIQSWDMAFKDEKASRSGNPDFVAGGVWGREQANKFLLDQVCDRMNFPQTCAAVALMTKKWPKARAKLVEDKANGPAVIATLGNKISGLIAVDPEGGKISRVNAVSPQIESGNVYLPHPMLFPWVSGFIEECAVFPNGAFDDQVDQMSQALLRLEEDEGDYLVGPGSTTGKSKWDR